MPYVFITTRFLFPNYFAFILYSLLWQLVSFLTSLTVFPPSLKSSSLWRLVAQACLHLEHSDADHLSPKIRLSKGWTPHHSTLHKELCIVLWEETSSPHISFSLVLTSTLLLSNASLRFYLGKIPMTTTSPVSPPSASVSSSRTSSSSPRSHPYVDYLHRLVQ